MPKATKTPPKRKNGRPTIYSPKIANFICEKIARGKSLLSICKYKSMPGYTTVREWLKDEKYREFQANFACAREDSGDTLADEIIEIADTEEDPNKARVRIDARKWIASKQKPGKYGDRQTVDVNVLTLEDKLRQLREARGDQKQLPEK